MAGKRYEGSAADNRADRRGARKYGMTLAQWERSPIDKAQDRRGQKRMNRRTTPKKK